MIRVRHFLKDTDVSSAEQFQLILVARELKRRPHLYSSVLTGDAIGLLFEKPSLRTRVSCETGAARLGAYPVSLRADELHFHRGELPGDSAAVLSGYLSLLLARVYKHSLLQALAEPGKLSVVNGLCDRYHPLQCLADLLTLYEAFNERLSGLTLAYVGDGNNVAHSLILGGVMAGLDVRIGTPQARAPEKDVVAEAEEIARGTGGSVSLYHSAEEAVEGADAVYTDVWESMGDQSDAAARTSLLTPFQLNEKLLQSAKPDAIALHCLPAHFGEEITRGVFESRQSRIIPQAHNRLPTAAAIFFFLLQNEKFLALANSL